MFNYYIKSILTISLFTFILNGCIGLGDKDRYSIKECKEEMLDAKDFLPTEKIDHIVVYKKERKMYLYRNGVVKSIFPISLGKNPIGDKVQQGDNRTPEGEFFIHRKLCSQRYYRSLCISYPRPEDISKAKALGVNPGGDITIHAQPKWNADGRGDKYTLSQDWTQGCIAVTNSVMSQLWYAVREGVPITIK